MKIRMWIKCFEVHAVRPVIKCLSRFQILSKVVTYTHPINIYCTSVYVPSNDLTACYVKPITN
jgi:hypothetical protein